MTTLPVVVAAGTKLSVPFGLTVTVPSAGLASVAAVTVNVSLVSGSTSLASTTMLLSAIPMAVLAMSVFAIGASLVPVTLTVKVLLLVAPALSLTV